MTQQGYSSHEEALQAVIDHMQVPLPVGHGLHPDSITDEPVRYHQWIHRFGDKVTHEHKRPDKEDE